MKKLYIKVHKFEDATHICCIKSNFKKIYKINEPFEADVEIFYSNKFLLKKVKLKKET